MRIIAISAVSGALVACGSAVETGAERTPEISDSVVAPMAKYKISMVCVSSGSGTSYGKKPTKAQTDCCTAAGCHNATVMHTGDGPVPVTCIDYICDCGLGQAGGTDPNSADDNEYLSSDCR